MNSTPALYRPKPSPLLSLSLLFVMLTGASLARLEAQTCTYTIQMFDSFGDGWNGGTLTVTSNGVVTTHTLPTGANGTSNFQVTNGAPVSISWTAGSFAFEPSFNLLNADGVTLFSAGNPIPAGVVYDGTGVCPNCPIPNPNLVVINQVTDSSAFVNWVSVNAAEYYLVEYGPAGFPFGSGIQVETTSSMLTLNGLNAGIGYDVYIAVFCGVDSVSSYIGPYSFQTDYTPSVPGGTCVYTLEFFDSFGDGWNGSTLTVTHNGITTSYTLPTGSAITYSFTATSNLPIDFSFSPGAFLNETSYEIIDPTGVVVFSDGPFPQTGAVFSTIACPTCPGPIDAWMSDVNATTAKFSWLPSLAADAGEPYIIEYGTMGFTLGTGTSDTIPGGGNPTVLLSGLTENTWYNAYIKLDCGTEFSKPLGPVFFKTIWINDIGVTAITAPDPDVSCDLGADEKVTVALRNFGQAPQTLFEFYFAVNGEVAPIPIPQDGLFTGVIGNDSTQFISFETTWDFSAPGFYLIEAWTSLEGDSETKNDTFRLEIFTAFPKPLAEDFEDSAIPAEWTNTGFIYAPNSHNNPTHVVAANLYAGIQTFSLETYRFGPILEGDSLFFDYRYVNWSAGTIATTLGANDKLEVFISDDCEVTFDNVLTINSANHVTSNVLATKAIPLDGYVGKAINVLFRGTWGSGDYWLDLDNINVPGCPESLQLVASSTPSVAGDSTGGISLTAYLAQGSLSVVWLDANGDTVSTAEDPAGLAPGIYTAFVTDVNGCQDSKDFEVGTLVGAAEEVAALAELVLYPNPTAGPAFLDVRLAEPAAVRIRVFDMQGQVVSESGELFGDGFKQELDLGASAPGMYIVQLVADGRPHYVKLMVAR